MIEPPLDTSSATKAIESLRLGIPPLGHLRSFTVGRSEEIGQLERSLANGGLDSRGSARLVQAMYGAGKTHLMRLLRELALDAGYCVALVTVDSQAGVRFNRMDQVAGAVMRELEIDPDRGPGAWHLFERFGDLEPDDLAAADRTVHERITAEGRWDMTTEMDSAGLYVALRGMDLPSEASYPRHDHRLALSSMGVQDLPEEAV